MSDQTPIGDDALESLLVLQEHDTALDKLAHRRESLPERAALADRMAEGAHLYSGLVELRGRRDEVVVSEKRVDDEMRSVTEKEREVEGRLYSGSTSSPRELQAMQADLDQIRKHRSSIEDRELGIMDEHESLDAAVAETEQNLASIAAEVRQLEAAIADAEATIDAEIAAVAEQRGMAAKTVPVGLVDAYERRRVQNRGVGAARLVGDTCQGCRLSIPATEVDRMRRAVGDGPYYCDNCGAILVPA